LQPSKNGDGRVVYLTSDRRSAIVSDADLRAAAVLLADGYNTVTLGRCRLTRGA